MSVKSALNNGEMSRANSPNTDTFVERVNAVGIPQCGLVVPSNIAYNICKLTRGGHPKALEIFIAKSRTFSVAKLLTSLPVFLVELSGTAWSRDCMSHPSHSERL
jgi:hypothetical protein